MRRWLFVLTMSPGHVTRSYNLTFPSGDQVTAGCSTFTIHCPRGHIKSSNDNVSLPGCLRGHVKVKQCLLSLTHLQDADESPRQAMSFIMFIDPGFGQYPARWYIECVSVQVYSFNMLNPCERKMK